MDKLNQLSNFAAMKEAAKQAANKAAGQMAGQLTQDRVTSLAQRLVTRLNEQIRNADLDPFNGPSGRSVDFSVPIFGCCILPSKCCELKAEALLNDSQAKGLASMACARDDIKVVVDGSSFTATFDFSAGPLEARFDAESHLDYGCVSLPPATIIVACDQIRLRLSLEGDFADKRIALLTDQSGLVEQPLFHKPQISCEGNRTSARKLKRLARRLATEERQRLTDLIQGQLIEKIKSMIEDPKLLTSL